MAKFFLAQSKAGNVDHLINVEQITSIQRTECGCLVRFGHERSLEVKMSWEQIEKQIGLN
jgi:hypothetical protein